MANFGYSPQEGVTFYYDNRGKVTDLCINPNVKPLPFAQEVPIASSAASFHYKTARNNFQMWKYLGFLLI